MTNSPSPRSILIAGASGGLGRAIATRFGAGGDTLTIVGRDADRLDAVPGTALRVATDLRDPANVAASVESAVQHGGGLDVVVNAVGVVAFGPVSDLTIDAMEELFLTNTFGASLGVLFFLILRGDGGSGHRGL